MHVLGQAGAPAVAPEAVAALGAQPQRAGVPRVARLARARAAHVGALGAVGTAARLGAAHAVRPHRTLLLAPGGGGQGSQGQGSCSMT